LFVLGIVHAPDEVAALELAAEQFNIRSDLRSRLMAKSQ
jgi:hypothetical protein